MSKKQKLKAEKEKKLEREEQKAEAQANEAVMETKRKAKQVSGGRPTSHQTRHEFE